MHSSDFLMMTGWGGGVLMCVWRKLFSDYSTGRETEVRSTLYTTHVYGTNAQLQFRTCTRGFHILTDGQISGLKQREEAGFLDVTRIKILKRVFLLAIHGHFYRRILLPHPLPLSKSCLKLV